MTPQDKLLLMLTLATVVVLGAIAISAIVTNRTVKTVVALGLEQNRAYWLHLLNTQYAAMAADQARSQREAIELLDEVKTLVGELVLAYPDNSFEDQLARLAAVDHQIREIPTRSFELVDC